jgi:hypothetical protein
MRSYLWALGVVLVAVAPACSSASDAGTQDGDAAAGSGGAGGSVGAGGSSKTGGASAAGGTQGSGGAKGTGGAAGGVGIGGAQGTGGVQGTGGAGDGGPHTVGKCDGLGAVGQWENITPPGVTLSPPYTGTIVAIADPQNSGTVYTTTSSKGVFKSTDCGATWTKTNTGRNAQQLDSGSIWSAVIDPVASGTLYALTGYGPAGLWKTTNGGVDWDQVFPSGIGMPGFVARVTMDPTDHLHLIINFHNDCTGGHTPVCFGETKDGGTTWNVLDFPPSIANAWGEGTAVLPIDATHWLYENWNLYYSSDAGATWKLVTPGGKDACGGIQGGYFKALNGAYYLTSQNCGVLTSPDGATWSKIPSSGSGLDVVGGDGSRLYAAQGFQPPGSPYIWSAAYSDPTHWSVPATPGLPSTLSAGFTSMDVDMDHHVLYSAIQAAGLWRVVTR